MQKQKDSLKHNKSNKILQLKDYKQKPNLLLTLHKQHLQQMNKQELEMLMLV